MDEYIDRELLQVRLNRKKAGPANQRYTEGWNDAIMMVKSMVHSAPAADVAPVRHGSWNDINSNALNPVMAWVCRCSLCGCPQDYKHNFCPNCGAKMNLEDKP